MAGSATFEFQRCMLEYEWALFAAMAFHACHISSCREVGLFGLESAMSVVTIGTLHCALEHFVVERLCELRFLLIVAAKAKLRLALLQHCQ